MDFLVTVGDTTFAGKYTGEVTADNTVEGEGSFTGENENGEQEISEGSFENGSFAE